MILLKGGPGGWGGLGFLGVGRLGADFSEHGRSVHGLFNVGLFDARTFWCTKSPNHEFSSFFFFKRISTILAKNLFLRTI